MRKKSDLQRVLLVLLGALIMALNIKIFEIGRAHV